MAATKSSVSNEKTLTSISSSAETSHETLVRAVRGGLAGMLAAFLQVLCLMWLRTAMNHQYFHGGSFTHTLSTLWEEGGVGRLYQGVSIALLQVPLSRFGDTFVETGVVAVLGMP